MLNKKERHDLIILAEKEALISRDVLTLLDAFGVNYCVIDKTGNYLIQNGNLAKILLNNLTNAELVDKSSWANCQAVMQSSKIQIVEEEFNKCYFLSLKKPLIKDGEVLGIAVLSFDITQRKKAETLEKELLQQEKNHAEKVASFMHLLASSIAHELRTPLRNISSNAFALNKCLPVLIETYELAQKAGLTVPNMPIIDHKLLLSVPNEIEAEAREAFIAIDMLLAKSGTSNLDQKKFEVCSIRDCVNEALARYPFDYGEKEEVVFTLDSASDFQFFGRKILLIHVIFNLLKNALYYLRVANKGDAGKIYIWLSKGTGCNYLHFKDTGAGIAPDILPHIFERFFSRTQHGTGIGLSFVKMVMQSFGGDITCNSIKHEFTEFTLKFPLIDKNQR